MSSPWKKQPEEVVDSVLKRAEVGKVCEHVLFECCCTVDGWIDLGKYRILVLFSFFFLYTTLQLDVEGKIAGLLTRFRHLDYPPTAKPPSTGPVQD